MGVESWVTTSESISYSEQIRSNIVPFQIGMYVSIVWSEKNDTINFFPVIWLQSKVLLVPAYAQWWRKNKIEKIL